MKIVDYETFIRMPAGTIFAPWKPCIMENYPEIKIDPGEEYDGKWMFNGTCPIIPEPIPYEGFNYGEVESEFWFYDGDSNDAKMYSMFLIFEEQDINNMIRILEWAKLGCPEEKDPNEYLKGVNQSDDKT